jgi:F-type H+-transporting ATPase subunit alpha
LLSFIAPLCGVSVAEFIRDNGYDVLICYDCFSKHAKVYRQFTLIQGVVPGRDAYPSDIFNVHSALLERCCSLKYSGTITAFPIIETINSDISEFIATNVISITDGQIYTSSQLFKNACTPAIDSALSVSRVGTHAQFKLCKMLVGTIKNDLTNYRNLQLNQIADEESNSNSNQTLAKVKGKAVSCMFYQD